ncbi:MAG: thiamine diphosphokinase [Fimbriimonas sp.]|nr:thiamine diphosphokinase [Fimbriimonas sp.]
MVRTLNKDRILGVLAGQDLNPKRVAKWAESAEFVVAADGGANLLYDEGIIPDVAIGDFDSIYDSTKTAQTTLVHAPDQDTSDCEKLLDYVRSIGGERITLCSVEGDHLDHLMATFHAAAKSPLDVRLVVRRGIVQLLKGPVECFYDLPVGTRLSLLPITVCSIVDLHGVQWPLVDVELSPAGMFSLSNRTTGPVQVSITSGVAALFLSHPSLELPHWSGDLSPIP